MVTDDRGGFKRVNVEIEVLNSNPYDVNADGVINFRDVFEVWYHMYR